MTPNSALPAHRNVRPAARARPPVRRAGGGADQARHRALRRAAAESGLDWPAIRGLVAGFEPTIAAFDATYLDEMRGIAEGAGVDYAAIVLLNARTEILKLARRRAEGNPVPDADPDGCTGIVALPGIPPTARSSTRRTGTGRRNAPKPRWCCASGARTDPTS